MIGILILLLLTGITSGAEAAFFSLTAKDIDYLKTKNKGNAGQVVRLLQQPRLLARTFVVTKVCINIAIIVIANFLLNKVLDTQLSFVARLVVQVVAVAFLLVFFGAVLPRVYAMQNTTRMALIAAPVLNFLTALFSPLSEMLITSSSYIEEKIDDNSSGYSEEDFEQAIELSVGHTATVEEVNIFKGILKFSNITVRQIMRTRLDVSGIPYGYNFQQLQKFVTDAGYSRMPVYKDSLDTIVGMMHSKDLLPYSAAENFDWHTLIRAAYYVPENKLINDLLKEFKQKRTHFAVVVDEFGGTSGIVTLEDIMEEIIGDIKDEFDDDDLHFKKLDDNNYIFDGKTLINDVCKAIEIPVEVFDKIRGESDSLGGLILEIAGKFPALNETVNYKNFDFTVLETDKMRIKRVKVSIAREV